MAVIGNSIKNRVLLRVTFVVGAFLLLLWLPVLSAQGSSGRTHWRQTAEYFEAQITGLAGSGLIRDFEQNVKFARPTVGKATGSFSVDLGAYYDRVDLAGLATWDAEPGAPLLPVRPLRILIPYNERVIKIKVIKGHHERRERIAEECYIEPAVEPTPISRSKEAKPAAPNPKIYESDSIYPAIPCGDAVIQKIRGYSILSLNLFPVAYRPARRKIAYFPEMQVQIRTQAMDGPGDGIGFVDPGYADEIRRMVENPEVLGTYPAESSSSESQGEVTALPPGTFEYVIITNNALRDAAVTYTFQDLIDIKTALGLTATIVTVEDIYSAYDGTENGDNADRIRQFISDAYVNWGTRWVLLGGDIEIVPQRGVYASTGSYVEQNMPTDLYYACLDGPWNYDGDGLWGESNDGTNGGDIDLSAEVYVGRAPVSNGQELSNFIQKTIQYETVAHIHGKRAVWMGEKLDDYPTWGSTSSIAIKNLCLPNDWNVIERYDSAGGWSGTDFVGDLDDSPHAITHLGHANQTYNARINNSNVAGLSNTDPYFMYSQGCQSGSFDTHDICIAEQHVVSTAGAVGVVMNARYGWYAPASSPSFSHHYALEFWDAIFNETKISFGQANQDARDDNDFRVLATGVYRWIHFETNLFGDPQTQFQLVPPPPPSEIHGTVVDVGSGLGVAAEVVFLDEDGDGVLDAGEQSVMTGVDGSYAFTNLTAGTYYVCHELAQYWEHTSPVDGVHEVILAEEEVRTGIDFLMEFIPPPPPDAPSNLSANAVSHEQIDLSWADNSDNEEWFKIERSLDGVNFNQIAQVSANITTYSDSGLDADTTYYYQVCASNAGDDSGYSNTASATTYPQPPVDQTATGEQNVAGTVSGSYIDTQDNDGTAEAITERQSGGKPSKRYSYLEHTWTFDVEAGSAVTFNINAWAPASSEGDTFVFTYSTDGSDYTEMFTISAGTDDDSYQTFPLPAATSGTVYVQVTDTDRSQGNRNLDTVYVDHMFIRTEFQPGDPPAAPTGLAASAVSASQIDLAWTDNADDEYGFEIERSDDGIAGWTLIDTVGTDVESYSHTGLAASTTYYYRVRAYNGSGISGYSNIGSATTLDASSIHVCDLDGTSELSKKSRWNAVVTITVHDQGSNPVVGATVTGSWSDGATGGGSGVTDGDGQCSIAKNNLKTNVGSVTFTVDGVSCAGYIYEPESNDDPDGDSDGTTIIVSQP